MALFRTGDTLVWIETLIDGTGRPRSGEAARFAAVAAVKPDGTAFAPTIAEIGTSGSYKATVTGNARGRWYLHWAHTDATTGRVTPFAAAIDVDDVLAYPATGAAGTVGAALASVAGLDLAALTTATNTLSATLAGNPNTGQILSDLVSVQASMSALSTQLASVAGLTATVNAIQTATTAINAAVATISGRVDVAVSTRAATSALVDIGTLESELSAVIASNDDVITATAFFVDLPALTAEVVSDLADLPSTLAGVSAALSGVSVTVVSPVAAVTGNVTVYQGDDQAAAASRALKWTSSNSEQWPDLTGAAIVLQGDFTTNAAHKVNATGSVVTPTGANKQVMVELDRVTTMALKEGTYAIQVIATTAVGKVETLVDAEMEVVRRKGA